VWVCVLGSHAIATVYSSATSKSEGCTATKGSCPLGQVCASQSVSVPAWSGNLEFGKAVEHLGLELLGCPVQTGIEASLCQEVCSVRAQVSTLAGAVG
jgi:hypothetical protein